MMAKPNLVAPFAAVWVLLTLVFLLLVVGNSIAKSPYFGELIPTASQTHVLNLYVHAVGLIV
jgi:hypothetical protein